MSYITKTLGQGEKIIYRAQFNWTYSFAAWLWLFAGMIPLGIAAFVFIKDPSINLRLISPFGISSSLAMLAGATILVQRIAHIATTEIVVTNVRLTMKTGWISRNSHEVSIANIEEVTFHQSLFGRLLGYGELIIRGTGIGEIRLPPLGHPLEIQRHIDDARAALRKPKLVRAA